MLDAQLVAIASASILAVEHFPRTTEDWEQLPAVNKTWTAWKTAFLQAHAERKQLLQATGGEESFQGQANAAMVPGTSATYEKLDTFLDDLANAATANTATEANTGMA